MSVPTLAKNPTSPKLKPVVETKALGDLLSDKQIEDIRAIVRTKPEDEWQKAFLEYLEPHKLELEAKGVLAGYLSWLLYSLAMQGKLN